MCVRLAPGTRVRRPARVASPVAFGGGGASPFDDGSATSCGVALATGTRRGSSGPPVGVAVGTGACGERRGAGRHVISLVSTNAPARFGAARRGVGIGRGSGGAGAS